MVKRQRVRREPRRWMVGHQQAEVVPCSPLIRVSLANTMKLVGVERELAYSDAIIQLKKCGVQPGDAQADAILFDGRGEIPRQQASVVSNNPRGERVTVLPCLHPTNILCKSGVNDAPVKLSLFVGPKNAPSKILIMRPVQERSHLW